MATETDRARLRAWREALVKGLEEARAGGHADELAREGALLSPDAALAGPELPVGSYRCRTLKLGTQGRAGSIAFVAYRPFDCRVAPGRFGPMLTKLTGSQRPHGRLFRGDDRRLIFLGTLLLGDETRAINYGRDRDRDMIGAVERVEPRRWRLVLPYPRFESTVDVIELVPAS